MKKKKKKKNHKEKKNAKKGGSLPSNSYSALSFLASTFGLLFLLFRFKRFLLGIFFFSSRRKERKTQKKIKCKERRELTFLLLLLHLGWSIPLTFPSPHSFNVELSTFFKFCVSHFFEVLCYSSLRVISSFGDGMSRKWSERGRIAEVGRRRGGEVGRRGKFWGREGGWKLLG